MAEWREIAQLELVGAGGEPVDLRRTLASHGVATLAPQHIDEEAGVLDTTLAHPVAGAHSLRIRAGAARHVLVEVPPTTKLSKPDPARLANLARHLLALDADLSPFYAKAARDPALSWITAGAGRMLRSPSVYESVVKTICTTNCAWSATIRMVGRIVEHLGAAAPDGSRAFPSPAAMAGAGESFYREVARAGYRSGSLQRLATDVAEGTIDLESLADPDLPDEEVRKRLLALPGVGPYAAAHVMLISLGRYKDLVLDSWTRPTFAELTGKPATDAAIAKHFKPYGDWAGLAFWLLLTRNWIE